MGPIEPPLGYNGHIGLNRAQFRVPLAPLVASITMNLNLCKHNRGDHSLESTDVRPKPNSGNLYVYSYDRSSYSYYTPVCFDQVNFLGPLVDTCKSRRKT